VTLHLKYSAIKKTTISSKFCHTLRYQQSYLENDLSFSQDYDRPIYVCFSGLDIKITQLYRFLFVLIFHIPVNELKNEMLPKLFSFLGQLTACYFLGYGFRS
jgi:hypothetical protein